MMNGNDKAYPERLQALLSKESSSSNYRTTDYLTLTRRRSTTSNVTASTSSVEDPPTGKRKRGLATGPASSSATKYFLAEEAYGSDDDDSAPAMSSEAAKGIGKSTSNDRRALTRKHWREMMITWAYNVIDHFDSKREIVSIAFNYIDRYMATLQDPYSVTASQYQLISMTCIYLAVKLYEFKHLAVPNSTSTMDTIRMLSQGTYTLQQMEMMEIDILQRLSWYVHPPTPQDYIHLFLGTFYPDVGDLGHFLVELSVMDFYFVCYKPSEVAAAAILNAVDQLHGALDPLSSLARKMQPFMNCQRVQQCRDRLIAVVRQMDVDDINNDEESSSCSQSQQHCPKAPPTGASSPVTVTTKCFG